MLCSIGVLDDSIESFSNTKGFVDTSCILTDDAPRSSWILLVNSKPGTELNKQIILSIIFNIYYLHTVQSAQYIEYIQYIDIVHTVQCTEYILHNTYRTHYIICYIHYISVLISPYAPLLPLRNKCVKLPPWHGLAGTGTLVC